MAWYKCGSGSAPQPQQVTQFRYIKMSITKVNGANMLQFSELGFRDSEGNNFTFPASMTATSSMPAYTASETVDKLFDGNTSTKLCISFPSGSTEEVTIDLGEGNYLDINEYMYYYWCSANDQASRDPETWKLYGANQSDFSDKVVLDDVKYLRNCSGRSVEAYCAKMVNDKLTVNPYTNYEYYETTQQITDLSNFTKLYNTSVAFGSNGTKVDTALGLTNESTITANMLAGWDSANSCYYTSENLIGAYGGYDFGQELYISNIKLWIGKYVNQNKDLPIVVQYLDSNNTWQDYKKFDIDASVEYPYHVLDISFEFSCYGIRWIHNEVTKTSGNNISFFGMTLYQPNTSAKRVYKLTQLSATVPQGYSGFGNLLIGTPKTYIKFNGQGIVLPWTLNSDYRIEVVFYEHYFRANGTIIGNTNNNGNYSHLTSYNNKYYTSTGTSETNFGTWAAGEHTFVNNDGNGHNVFDGVEVTSYTPTTNTSLRYTIGCRTNASSNVYYGLIKSYKIYSLTTLNLIHDFRPCEVLGMACFYDTIDNAYYPVPEGQALDSVF